eukprot:6212898-Pleurochrysis_carterae.AAC.5
MPACTTTLCGQLYAKWFAFTDFRVRECAYIKGRRQKAARALESSRTTSRTRHRKRDCAQDFARVHLYKLSLV